MGISYYNVGQKNEALAALNKYLELEPVENIQILQQR
jgi:hypothetical protein